jgi:tartrate-resistant acid phosphatase type 5
MIRKKHSIVLSIIALLAIYFTLHSTALGSMITSWIYEIVGGEHTVANQQPIPSFKVHSFADNSSSIRCMVIGDWGTGNSMQRTVAQGMEKIATKEKAQFVISTGDNFYPDGIESVNDKQLTTKWKNIYSFGALTDTPWYLVLGNHDYHTNPFAQVEYSRQEPRWIMPTTYYTFIKKSPDSTSVNQTSTQFFMIDTEELRKAGTKDKDGKAKQQLTWLESELKRSTAQWKVVVGHHMIRSHGAYGDQPFMLESIKPLLDKYGVQLYLNGHDHDIQYLKAEEDSFPCIISGAGGGARKTSYGANTLFASTNGGVVYLAFTKEHIHAQFASSNGTILYATDVR